MRIVTHHTWLAWLAIAFGVLYAVSLAQDIDTVAETRRWPTTQGTIVVSSFAMEEVGRWRNGPRYARRLHLMYVYEVGGSRYTGTRWNALPASSNQATHAMLRRYPEGQEVVVHYDAHDPASAVLDTSWPILKYVELVCAIAFAITVWMTTRSPIRRRATV